MEKYTYENWWNGDVTLALATIYSTKEDKPIVVNWADFNESDIDRIKEKQVELFSESVNNLLKTHCEQFTKRYAASEMKSEYLADERQECWNIMRGDIPKVEIVILNHWKIGLDYRYLSKVQNYIERRIKDGIDDGLGFVHSPNCKYQDKSLPDSRIYARFVFEYSEWLKSFIAIEEIVVSPSLKVEPEFALPTNEQKVEEKELVPDNPYPKIFISYVGFQIFEAFISEVITKSTEYADYSYLFGMLKKDEFIHNIKQKKFIDFIAGEYGATELAVNYKQLKVYYNAKTPLKESAYLRIKKKFQNTAPSIL